MGCFWSCFHVPDSDNQCFCPGCLLHKLKNKMQHDNVCTETQDDVSSPDQEAACTNPALPLNTASAASPNDVAESSIASSRQQEGERGRHPSQVDTEPFPESDVDVETKSLQGAQILVSPNQVKRFKSYARALVSGLDSYEHMFPSSDYADECPTCLEEYSPENPKIMAKCNHHYHLSCIYEWMERNENCPVCGKLMLFDE